MASLLLISGCGPPVWLPDAGSYVDSDFFEWWLSGVRNSFLVVVEAGEIGQEPAIWALGRGCGGFIGSGIGFDCLPPPDQALYVLPSESGATVVWVTRWVLSDSYTVHHASNVTLERNADLLRAEFWATRQEYELQEEEFISLGSSETVKLRFQLDMEPAPDNASNTGISEWVIASLDYAPDNATEVLTYTARW